MQKLFAWHVEKAVSEYYNNDVTEGRDIFSQNMQKGSDRSCH